MLTSHTCCNLFVWQLLFAHLWSLITEFWHGLYPFLTAFTSFLSPWSSRFVCHCLAGSSHSCCDACQEERPKEEPNSSKGQIECRLAWCSGWMWLLFQSLFCHIRTYVQQTAVPTLFDKPHNNLDWIFILAKTSGSPPIIWMYEYCTCSNDIPWQENIRSNAMTFNLYELFYWSAWQGLGNVPRAFVLKKIPTGWWSVLLLNWKVKFSLQNFLLFWMIFL